MKNKKNNPHFRTGVALAAASFAFLLGGTLLLLRPTGTEAPLEPLETASGRDSAMPVIEVHLTGHAFSVEVARTRNEQARGLMGRDRLGEREGMLFLGQRPQIVRFWMKDTLVPLDIVFLDESWRVVDIHANAEPCPKDPCPAYSSATQAMHVLEVAGGQTLALGTRVGETLVVPDPLLPTQE